MAKHNELGKLGEKAACELLVSKGLVIRECNWRMNRLEVDIIAYEEGKSILHIVEVKTRSNDEHYNPIDAITRAKQRNLINAANTYIRYQQLKCAVQYDIIFVIGKPDSFKIEYIPDALYPPLKTYR